MFKCPVRFCAALQGVPNLTAECQLFPAIPPHIPPHLILNNLYAFIYFVTSVWRLAELLHFHVATEPVKMNIKLDFGEQLPSLTYYYATLDLDICIQ